jgi:AraC-like DNA-binding protein
VYFSCFEFILNARAADRKNGTFLCYKQYRIMQPVARYREFDPCPPLRGYVRCFFTFSVPAGTCQPHRPIRRERLYRAPESYTTPLFADSHVSLSFTFGIGYRVDGLWSQAEAGYCGHVIGPMSAAHAASHGDRIVQVGAYLRPARAKCFFATPAGELTDRILPLSGIWGKWAVSLETSLGEAGNDEQRVNQLERALLQRLRFSPDHRFTIDLPALAAFVHQRRGAVTVAGLADSAGVSRQHLARIFREELGLPPKLFCRLARFRAALACAARNGKDDGAGLAAELGYADQSHMIAEFREFSGLTPKPLMLRQRVHPFMDLSGHSAETI